jgi:septal ring factor EnvC (AmiA/AmiB activator)
VVDAPDEPSSAADLVAEQERRRGIRDGNETVRRELAAAKDRFREVERRIAAGKAEIAKLEKALADARALLAADERDLETARQRGKALVEQVNALADPDLDEIPARLREVEAVNERVRQKKARAALAGELAAAESEASKLSAEIEAIDGQKAAVLDEASFPVPGLGFGERGVTLNGLPLDQASAAEQLRVSMAMGLALNPKLPVVLIRDGSLLDAKSLALVSAMAEAAKAQVWLEVVGKGGVGVVIEDGQVEGAAAQAEKGAA